MALTLEASGTSAAADRTPGSEHSLATVATVGVFQFWIDLAALSNGQTLAVKIYYKVLTGGTERTLSSTIFQHAQAEPVKFFLPLASDISVRFGITETGGTEQSYPWKVLKLSA